MKHLFKMLVIAVLLTSKAFAQTDPVRAELDHIFQYIHKSQVPSGYLDEYGPQFAEKNGTKMYAYDFRHSFCKNYS